MNKYRCFFRFMGKKYQTDIEATSKYEAEQELLDKLILDEVRLMEGTEPVEGSNSNSMDFLKNMFGMR